MIDEPGEGHAVGVVEAGLEPGGFRADAVIRVMPKPLHERFSYGTRAHDELLAFLIARRDAAQDRVKEREDAWNAIDGYCRHRVDLSRSRKKADGSADATKKEMPYHNAVILPLTYAILNVLEAQALSVFLSRNPFMAFEGRGKEDVVGAKLLEVMGAYDLQQMAAVPTVAAAVRSTLRYGVGVMFDCWEQDMGWKMRPPRLRPGDLDPLREMVARQLVPEAFEPSREWGSRREFVRWTATNPRLFGCDPRTPWGRIQEAEYWWMRLETGYMYLAERSREAGGPYINVDEVGTRCGASSRHEGISGGADISHGRASVDEWDKGEMDLDHLQVNLIPRDVKFAGEALGEEDKPVKYWFSWVDDTVVVRVHPSSYAHGQFNVSVGESIPDPHQLWNPGFGDQLDGFQRFSDWSVNTHIQNIRKALNDVRVVAPSLIEMGDVQSPNPAGIFRLTPEGERLVKAGTDPNNFYRQLQVMDVTGPHLSLAGYLFEQAQRMSGANDPMQGMQLDSQRTATEVQTMMASASQRMSIIVQMIDAQLFQPLSRRWVSTRQQFTSNEQWYKVPGELASELMTLARQYGMQNIEKTRSGISALIGGKDLWADVDYVPHTGLMPPDPRKQVGTWMQVLGMLQKVPPQMLQTDDGRVPDVSAILNEVFRLMGIKDMDSFYRQAPQAPQGPPEPPADVRVVPDEEYAAAVQRGDAVLPEEMPQ